MKRTVILMIFTSALSIADSSAGNTRPMEPSYFDRLQSDNPNYFVVATPIDNEHLEGDDPHIEFSLSIKYPFALPKNDRWWQPEEIAMVYNGLYDFYLIPGDRYDSAPIISRRQNPGAALDWILTENSLLRFAYFHESNGQTLDPEDGSAAYLTEVAQGGEDYAFGQVSRGWDYLQLRYACAGGTEWIWNSHLEFRGYLHRQGLGTAAMEDDIFWDAADDSKIQDYDGLRLMLEQRIPRMPLLGKSALRLELQTGTSDWNALENIGGKISIKWWDFFHVFYFNGYGKEPSSYHLRTEYIGVGLEFR